MATATWAFADNLTAPDLLSRRAQETPEALAVVTGQKQMDATAIRDYFAPLQQWLDEQNQGKPTGW